MVDRMHLQHILRPQSVRDPFEPRGLFGKKEKKPGVTRNTKV